MDESQLREWLDANNKNLLSEIEKVVPVMFTLWGKNYYACQVHKNTTGAQCEAEVFYKEPLSQAKLAHELLHAKTSVTLGDNQIMFSVSNPSQPFCFMMANDNASNIVNVCEHNIFFPDYLDMGYLEEDSFEQPQDLAEREREISYLVNHGLRVSGHYSIDRVFQYFGLVFSFLFYPNDERFKKEVKQLRKIDVPLFCILKKLKDNCSDVAIIPDNKEHLQDSYFEFANDINNWLSKAFKGVVLALK